MSLVGQSPAVGRSGATRWQFLALELPRGTGFGHHHHGEHQLVVVDRGALSLSTPEAEWAVPRGRGVWIPSDTEHEVAGLSDAAATFVYLRSAPDWVPPTAGAIVGLTPMLREAISLLAASGARRGDRRARLEAVLLDEVADLQPVRQLLPLPIDPAARMVAARLIEVPSDDRTLDELGAAYGASGRTLQRRFSEETGSSFRTWRQRARMQHAMVDLEMGKSVTVAAHDSGFASASAFVTAFRTSVGTTPAAWARLGCPSNQESLD